MRTSWRSAVLAVAVAGLIPSAVSWAAAEPITIKAVMAPKEQIRHDFPTPDKHFVLMVRREGTVSGTAAFEGAQGMEYGVHDITPGVGGNPRGYYIVTLKNGDKAVIEWSVQATFIPGPDGKPKLLDNGVWKFIGGTGGLTGIQGAGTMHIKAVSPTDREFSFTGEFFVKKGS
jgi:hypothetical protein